LRALQMIALHRAGRRAEALAAYQEARRQLVDQLGVEPGADLQRVHLEVLADQADVPGPPDPPSAPGLRRLTQAGQPADDRPQVPRLLPPDVAGFTGRTEPVVRLRQMVLGRTETGQPWLPVQVVAIFGKGGVGKTAFARRLAHELARAFPDGQLYADLSDE